jgi:predicted metal-binding membrane protein
VGGFRVPVPERAGRLALWGSIVVLTGLAWLVLVVSDDALHRVVHLGRALRPGHHGGGASGSSALLFLVGWTVMCVAMMLPTSLPVLATLHALAGERRDRLLLVGLAASGYLVAWAAFGVLVYGASLALPAMTAMAVGAGWGALWGAPVLLVLAGAFQFSRLKYRCLDQCRSPLSFVLGYWHGRRERWHAFRLGLHNGAYCVGCCWALMLLMFLVGLNYLALMLALGTVMAVEKNIRWGRRLSAPLGVVLILAGVAVGAARYLG